MKHAIAANSCPFCGNQIFQPHEVALRKSISRILIKNGLDNDEVINKIVDDILALSSGGEASPEPPTQITSAAQPRPTINPSERGDDGLTESERRAPARVLTPAPRPMAQMVTSDGVDPISAAMRVFEEENADPMRRVDADPLESIDENDASGIFFMERGGGEKVEARRAAAQAARQAGLMGGGGTKRTTPAFSRT